MVRSTLNNFRFWLSLLLVPTLAWGTIKTFDAVVATKLDVDNVRIDGNTMSITNTNGGLTITPNGTGNLTLTSGSAILSGLTASTVPYLDSSKKLTSSAVTSTELGYLSGIPGAINTVYASPLSIWNCGLTVTAQSNVLIVTLVDAAGSALSTTSPCRIGFRSATATTGTNTIVSATSQVSNFSTLTVSNGAALGCTASVNCKIGIYAINDAGSIRLAVSGDHRYTKFFDEGTPTAATSMSSSADSLATLYSGATVSASGIRLLGYVDVVPGASFAWTNSPTGLTMVPFDTSRARSTDWIAFTPSNGSWTTNSTYTGFWRREGPDMLMNQKLSLSGAPNNTSLQMNLPTGFTLDTAKMLASSSGFGSPLCEAFAVDSGAAVYSGYAVYNGGSSITIYVNGSAGATTNSTNYSTTVPFTWGSGDWVEVKCRFPITGWD